MPLAAVAVRVPPRVAPEGPVAICKVTCEWSVVTVLLLASFTSTVMGGAMWALAAAGVLTVGEAMLVVAVPPLLVKTASYLRPFSTTAAEPRFSVVEVAPGIDWKLLLPAAATNHWTVGAGEPVAEAVNVTAPPT